MKSRSGCLESKASSERESVEQGANRMTRERGRGEDDDLIGIWSEGGLRERERERKREREREESIKGRLG
jgi:hypothetical protein